MARPTDQETTAIGRRVCCSQIPREGHHPMGATRGSTSAGQEGRTSVRIFIVGSVGRNRRNRGSRLSIGWVE